MKTSKIIISCLLLLTSLIHATAEPNTEPDKRITDIRKWYAQVEADKKLKVITFKTAEEEMPHSFQVTRYETADGKLRKLHVIGVGEHGESRTTYYFKEGKLLFVYESTNEWRFTGEKNKEGESEVIDIASQYRFYFDKGQCFKALEKRVELIGGDELNELLKQKPNKEIPVVAAIQAYHKKAHEIATIKSQETLTKYLKR